jgi:thioredoxin reductase
VATRRETRRHRLILPAVTTITDITIIGGGPTGLFGAFYAGMRGASCRLVDALPALGGQLMALYPEKYIFDVAGFPKVLAKDLVKGLTEQALQFGCEVCLDQVVTGLRRQEDGGIGYFQLETDRAIHETRTILIAAGIGAFEPRKLPADGLEVWEGKGLDYKVLDPAGFAGLRVLVVGGGDSAFDWVVNLAGIAKSVMLIHRRDGFRAHAATIREVERLREAGRCEVRTFTEVKAIEGENRVERVTLLNNKTGESETLPFDAVVPQLGFHSDLGPVKAWGLDTQKAHIVVDRVMSTNVKGIYAAGDVATYEGKLKLIATGAGEACTAVNNAVHYIYPKRKVDPGHSSDLDIFGPLQTS